MGNECAVTSGVMQCLDDRMNIALERAQEFSEEQTLVSSYPMALIRGNNGENPEPEETGAAGSVWVVLPTD